MVLSFLSIAMKKWVVYIRSVVNRNVIDRCGLNKAKVKSVVNILRSVACH